MRQPHKTAEAAQPGPARVRSAWLGLALLGIALLLALATQIASQLPYMGARELSQPAVVSAEPADVVLGRADAPATIVAFISATCIHCRAWETRDLGGIKSALLDTGRVRLVLRQFPLDRQALQAAALLGCIQDPEERARAQARLAAAPLSAWSDDAGLLASAGLEGADRSRAVACSSAQAAQTEIVQHAQAAAHAWGIAATPTFVTGRHVVAGSQDAAALTRLLER